MPIPAVMAVLPPKTNKDRSIPKPRFVGIGPTPCQSSPLLAERQETGRACIEQAQFHNLRKFGSAISPYDPANKKQVEGLRLNAPFENVQKTTIQCEESELRALDSLCGGRW